MNLIIDIGNTRVKAALFENDLLKEAFVFDSTKALLSSGILEKYAVKNCLLASVVNEIDEFQQALSQKLPVLLFNAELSVPLKNLYKTAHTLGSDRLAGAVGGNVLFPDQNVLVIDFGTCIKYNFVTKNNEYLGGAISPGLQMRLKAMHTFTSRLPLLDVEDGFDTLIGTSSKESMLSGAQIGAVAEVDGFIDRYKAQYPDIKVVLTGGDVNFFEKRLKNSIFADSNLILNGLNAILNYNLKK